MVDKKIVLGGILLAGLLLYAMTGKSAPTTVPLPKTNGPGSLSSAGTSTVVGQIQSLGAQLLKSLTGGKSGSSPGGSSAGAGVGFQGQSSTKTGANGQQQANIPSNYSEDAKGNITGPDGTKIGTRSADGGIDYVDGSHSYPDGVVWNPTDGYFYDPSGAIYTDDGTVIGQFDMTGSITAVQGAMFGGNGQYIGEDNGNGTYTDVDGYVYTNDGILLGTDNGDGTYDNIETGQTINSYTGQPEDGGDGNTGANPGDGNTVYGPPSPSSSCVNGYDENGDPCGDSIPQGDGYDQWGNYVGDGESDW